MSSEAAATLEHESGYRLESDDVSQLRHSVTHGLWDDAPAFLRRLGVAGENERVIPYILSPFPLSSGSRQPVFSSASKSTWNN